MTFFNKCLKPLWTACRVVYVNNVNNLLLKNRIKFSTAHSEFITRKTVRSMRSKKGKKFNLDEFSLALLVIPVSAFGLGTWQVFRKIRKEGLIENLKERVNMPPVELPQNLNELNNMEYCPVRVKGRFDHSREIYLGPRSKIKPDPKYSEGTSLFSTSSGGFLVITPFKLSDRNLTILVNRGWVPGKQKSPKTRQEGQITDEIELVGLVRLNEVRQPLGIKNMPEKGFWVSRDLGKMSEVTGAAPVFIDAIDTVPGGPEGRQTIVGMRNEHLSYIITWYTLSIITGVMWYEKYIRKVPR